MIGSKATNWQLPNPPRHNTCSPNLRAALIELQRRWPFFTDLGCFGARPIRGSTTIMSSHCYGSAIDVGYPAVKDDQVAAEVCPWIVARSEEMNIGAIHDYRRCRIWHAGRTPVADEACTSWWKAQRASSATGMGQPWNNHLHLEVTADGWSDDTPMIGRWTE
jgi:hypothetical protein